MEKSRFLDFTKRIAASGDENEAMHPLSLILVLFKFSFFNKFGKGNLELLKQRNCTEVGNRKISNSVSLLENN